MLDIFIAVLKRDLLLAWHERTSVLISVGFFVIVVSLYPFAIGPQADKLQQLAPGIIWIAALLSCLLSLHRIFNQDYEDAVLEQLLLSPEPAVVWVGAKVFAYWLVTSCPLVFITPMLALWLGMETNALLVLLLSLLLGTPVIAWLGAIGAALTLGLRSAEVLIALLILPLLVPVIILGTSAVNAHISGMGAQPYLLLLGAGCLFAMALAPLACAAALRISME